MKAIVAALLFTFTITAHAENYGSYIGHVAAMWDPNGRTMTLLEPFAYLDPMGSRWDAPVKSTVDGASIPRIAWSIIGGPFEGKYREASVIHDVACVEKSRPWEDVHYMFYTAMLASGVPTAKAKIMYAAVYHFGPRWPAPRETDKWVLDIFKTHLPPPPKTMEPEEFKKLAADIETREATGQPMTIENIREYK